VDRPSEPARGTGPAGGEHRDGGFTLVEVTVSLLLLAVVLAAALSLFVRAMANTDLQAQRGQAITIATDQLEQVRGFAVADLLKGRTQTSVDAIWAWDLTGVNRPTLNTVEAWDTTATASSTPMIPTYRTQRIDNVDYIVRTYVDKCFLPTTGSTTCGTSASSAKEMRRITVSVAWSTSKGRSCAPPSKKLEAGKPNCQEYVVTTLRDPSSEALFNTN
jgi:prepilin-type N-terminal cleavage/methylation domain-containing protein